ncbi:MULTISPECIES: DUF5707 domain-containing protein [unclassified Streptomyces]|uniref:DUF5707 domain-containing protein n=1 Tax=unclassified Streptomyces TaxID=2593676 RepID=UPI0035E34513
MSRRIVLSSAAAVIALGGVGAFALAHAEERPPAVENGAAHYTAPEGNRDGSFTFTADVTAPSGLKDLKVLAWPAADPAFTKNGLTVKDMAEVESATCRTADDGIARCTYRVTVTAADAAASGKGTWYVATLATADDGGTVFDEKTSTFTTG